MFFNEGVVIFTNTLRLSLTMSLWEHDSLQKKGMTKLHAMPSRLSCSLLIVNDSLRQTFLANSFHGFHNTIDACSFSHVCGYITAVPYIGVVFSFFYYSSVHFLLYLLLDFPFLFLLLVFHKIINFTAILSIYPKLSHFIDSYL